MKRQHVPAVIAATVAMAITVTTARADRCDDLAAQVANQIGGVKVGRAAANTVALSHPAVRTMHLGCRSRTVTNQIEASAEGRDPLPRSMTPPPARPRWCSPSRRRIR